MADLATTRFDVELSVKFVNRETKEATVEIVGYSERDVSAVQSLAVQKSIVDLLAKRVEDSLDKLKD